MTDLDLKELDRLEREASQVELMDWIRADAALRGAMHHQLRPLLDLVDALGNRLEEMDEHHGGYPRPYPDVDPLGDWRRAKGEA